MKKRFFIIFILLASLLPLQACAHPMFYRAKEFSGSVVDAETNKPLEGVVVVAQWIPFHVGFGEGGHWSVMEVEEAVTDKDGKYTIPGWGPIAKPAFAYLDNLDPQLSVFKRGYQYVMLLNSDKERFYKTYGKEYLEKLDYEEFKKRVDATRYESSKSTRESVWDGRVIKLKKFDGDNEKLRSMLEFVEIDVLDIEDRGVPLKKVKRMAMEWLDAIKVLQKPYLIYDFNKGLPSKFERILREDSK